MPLCTGEDSNVHVDSLKLTHAIVAVVCSGGSLMSRVGGFSSEYLAEDIEYLHRISSLQTIHGDFTLEMAIRGTYTLLVSSEGYWNVEGGVA